MHDFNEQCQTGCRVTVVLSLFCSAWHNLAFFEIYIICDAIAEVQLKNALIYSVCRYFVQSSVIIIIVTLDLFSVISGVIKVSVSITSLGL